MGIKTGFTLFSGGGGVDIAMQSLGVDVLGGIEYVDKIAQVARDNGLHTTTADILQCNPADFPAMDWLHASPPCPNFSVAKTGAKETENDFALARKVAEWATVHKPRVVTLENVIAYRKSESWRLIENALHEAGYWVHVAHVNFADYGVPQTRKRMIVRAVRGGFVPYLQPTHHKTGRDGLAKWIGWYEAIEDLIPTLPSSKFANWQLKRLPAEFRTTFYSDMQNVGRMLTIRNCEMPSSTVTASLMRRPISVPAAFVMNEGNPNGNEKRKYRNGDEPIKTVTAGCMVTRGFIINESSTMETRDDNSPTASQVASPRNLNQKAFITDRLNSSAKKPNRQADEPAMTMVVYSPKHQEPNGYAGGRVVKMTPRALARFQSFPDWYEFTDNAGLATRIIGNAVPPVGFANVMRNLVCKI